LGVCGASAFGQATSRRAMNDDRPERPMRERPRLLDDLPDDDRQDARVEDAIARERRRRGSNNGDWFRSPFQENDPQLTGGFPAYAVQDAVVANARAATARAMFRRAESALDGAVRQAKRTFESTPEYKEATEAERAAWRAYSDARKKAVESLKGDPEYTSLLKLRDDLSSQIAAKRQVSKTAHEPGVYVQDILAMASLKMRYALAAGALEAEAVASHGDVATTREKFRDANARLARLRVQFDESVRNDPDLLAARQSLSEARIAKLTAMAYFKGALAAADAALDFAYYLHRYDGSSAYGDFRHYYPYDYPTRTRYGYTGGYGYFP
jgi:hypothetical protein